LLFVFWYCHKRGRETRQEKDRQSIEAQIKAMDEPSSADTQTSTAAGAHEQGASYAAGGSLAKEMAKEKAPPSS